MVTETRREMMRINIRRALEASRAVLRGHFIGKSGKHLPEYVNKDRLFTDVHAVDQVGLYFAELAADKNIEVVVGPAVGGVVLAHKTAEHLSKMYGKKVMAVYTEKDANGRQIFKRGYDRDVAGKRAAVVEDILTTGGSLKDVIGAVKEAGGLVAGAYGIVNRDPDKVTPATFGVPFDALVDMPLQSFTEDFVPDWLAKIPIDTSVGHGAEYLAKRKK